MHVRAGLALLISAVGHTLLLAYLVDLAYEPRPHRPGRPDASAPPAPAPGATPPPIEVVFLTEDRGTQPRPKPPAHAPSRPPAIAGTDRQPGRGDDTGERAELREPPAARPGDGGGPGVGLLHMRGPDLALHPETAERIAAADAAPADELPRSGKLESQPGGRAVIHDRVTTVRVAQDGTAHFKDAKDIDPQLHLPIPRIWEVDRMRHQIGDVLAEWYADPEAGKRFGPSSELPRHLLAAPGACDQWGSTLCDDPLAPKSERRMRDFKQSLGRFLGGPLDITAWLHRRYIGDPYTARKRKLLADTFDERVAMGTAHRAEQRAHSAELMRGNLERLWARVRTPIARRAALFELWDECAEDAAGLRARAVVIGWIRDRLPAGSANAFTDEEIAALGARRTSKQPFEPY